MRRFWQKIMTHLEMRSFDPHYDPDETEMSAQERLLYNNNYNSNHHHHHQQHHHNHNNSNSHLANNGNCSGHSGTGSSVNSSNQHLQPLAMTSLDEENHYQLPYAHLHQQSPYLGHPAHNHQLHQPPPPHLQHHQGSYSSGDDHSSTYGGGPRPPMNGHNGGLIGGGSVGPGMYPHTYAGNFGTLQDKYSVAYPVRNEGDGMMGRRGNRNTGSGIVYRPRRKLWWAAMMLALILLVLAGAVVIAVYFTVLRKDPEPATVVDNGNALNTQGDGYHGSSGAGGAGDGADTGGGVGGDFGTRQPPYNVHGVLTTPPTGGTNPGNQLHGSTKVTRFEAFWHPGDSRIFKAQLANGTAIEVFGPKKSDGTVRSIYSLSLKNPGTNVDDSASTRFIRFQGGLNIASVVLPNGVIVNYDWSVEKYTVEVKVFEPFTEQTPGPISHIVKVDSGFDPYPLKQIHEAFTKMPIFSGMPSSGGHTRFSAKCFSRFPVTVTKCGGKYPYNGAFVQGEITGLGRPIMMAALPWPKDGNDPCYEKNSGSGANYYLPLPGPVDKDNATMIKEAYAASSAKIFYRLCDVVREQVHTERHKLCSDMAEKVRHKLGHNQLLDMVYTSCSAIFNALNAVCVAVNDVNLADAPHPMPEMAQPLLENALLRGFHRHISDSFPANLPATVDVKAHAYCQSARPMSSFESAVSTGSISGNVVQDTIHINCPNYPEVINIGLSHMLVKGQSSPQGKFDTVKKSIRVCSICSLEKEASVQILTDTMLCNNTCNKLNSQEKTGALAHIPETVRYTQTDSVYCSEFLTSVSDRMEPPIQPSCLSNCLSNFRVRFSIRDPTTKVLFYHQEVECSELKSSRCTMKFGK